MLRNYNFKNMFATLKNKNKLLFFVVGVLLSIIIIAQKREIDSLKENFRKECLCQFAGNKTFNSSFPPKLDKIEFTRGKPNYQYEKVRRRLRYTFIEFSFLIQNGMEHLIDVLKGEQKTVILSNSLYTMIRLQKLYKEFKHAMLNDFVRLKKVDGFDTWRFKEFQSLSDVVQKRLHHLQNPPDCKTSKKIVCNLEKVCGFGCAMHYLVNCFMASYFTGRTLVLDSKNWQYRKGVGWDGVFKPLSETCSDASEYEDLLSAWPGNETNSIGYFHCFLNAGHNPFLVPNLPHDIFHRINYIHDNPHIWWVGQFLKYMFRYNSNTEKIINDMTSKLNLKNPIVGIHVRHTDKINEAVLYPLESYIKWVDEFYEFQTNVSGISKNRIFLSTDDINIVKEGRKRFLNYDFLTDPVIGQLKPMKTHDESNIYPTIFNLHVLARIPTVICTLSSNFCRLMMELAAAIYPDETSTFRSLDTVYIWPFSKPFYHKAHIAHTAMDQSEISIEVGDIIHLLDIKGYYLLQNENMGYFYGLNLRTNKSGRFPSFKTKNLPTNMEHPTFKNGKLLFDQSS